MDDASGLAAAALGSGEAARELLARAVEASEAPTYVTDADWRIVYVNRGFTRLFGYRLDEVAGKTPPELLASEYDPAAAAAIHHRLHEGRTFSGDRLLRLPDGGRIWARASDAPIHDERGRLLNVVGVLTDITQSKLHETLQQAVLESMARDESLEAVMTLLCTAAERMAPDTVTSVLRVDAQGRLHPLAGPGLTDEYKRQLEGMPIGPRHGSCGTSAYLGEAVTVTDIEHDPLWDGYRHLVRPMGFKACWSTPIKNSHGRVVGTFAFYFRECRGPSAFIQRLVSVCAYLCALALEREASQQRIRELAFFDALTGLPNRALLLAQADRVLGEAARTHRLAAVLFVDLDRFKQINDVFGHAQGDALLSLVAERLRGNLDPEDIIGRLVGDEFVLVLMREDLDQIHSLLERLRGRLSEPCQVGASAMTPAASIGVSLFPDDGHDMGSLLQRAGMARLQAKRDQRGSISFYRETMNHALRERLALEAALREALAEGRMRLAFQPQVALKDGRLYGVEALARWHHPQWGDIPPSRFIPLAEECGLIQELSQWVLRDACRQLTAWRGDGFDVPAISVNLSPLDFRDPELPATIGGVLREFRLAPRDLVVELTENILLDADPNTQSTLRQVHAQGVRVAMDDFGAGYSSLGSLRRLPIDELKLDKSFVDDLEHDPSSRALSQAVIGIGDSLKLVTVAEGIETESQREILMAQGYHAGQGYLFSPPLPAGDFREWWRGFERAHAPV